MTGYILFMVHPKGTNIRVFVYDPGREGAKDKARNWLGNGWGGPDNWEVTPLTEKGDRVHLNVTLSG